MSPFPFTVAERDCVAEPNEPTLEFTVARVYAFVLFAVPSNEEPALVTSPVAVPIVRAVCRAVAVQALPVTLVWSHVFVPLVFARRVISVSFVYLLVAVSAKSSVSRTTTPVCQFTESTAPPPVIAVRANSPLDGL